MIAGEFHFLSYCDSMASISAISGKSYVRLKVHLAHITNLYLLLLKVMVLYPTASSYGRLVQLILCCDLKIVACAWRRTFKHVVHYLNVC